MNKDKPKKILIFSLAYFPFVGGAEVAIKEITDRIDPEDVQFDMVTLHLDKNIPKFEREGNVNIYRVGFTGENVRTADLFRFPLSLNKYLLIPLGFIKALSLHRKNKYDAIWSMMATYNSFAAILFKLLNSKVKFLLTLQEGDPFEHIKKRAKPLWPLFTRIFRKADHIQVISNYLKEFARDMGYEGEISVVPNAVNVKHFENFNQLRVDEIRKNLNKKEDDIWLVTVSRLVYKNAVDDIIGALPLLPSNIKLLILGEGPLQSKLEDLSEELGVLNRVKFVGHIFHKDLPNYLKASDIFIRPSRSEGFGNSFVEAMAAKLPVIATDVGGISDFLIHKKTGLVCGLNDSNDIAHKVDMYTRDINLRNEIIDNAYEMVKEKYDWNTVSIKMKDIFIKL